MMREKLQERLTEEFSTGAGIYEDFARKEIVDSYAWNSTLADEQLEELLSYEGNLLEYLYSIFAKGEDAFAEVVREKLDSALAGTQRLESF